MEIQNEGLMHREFEEEWEVDCGEKFVLNEEQVKVLKDASIGGNRGLVWFDGFAISIPHIRSVYRVGRKPKQPADTRKVIRWEFNKDGTSKPIYE